MAAYKSHSSPVENTITWHHLKHRPSPLSPVVFLLHKSPDAEEMMLAILCLCLAGAASAAPSPFRFTSHFTGPRQQAKALPFAAGQPLPQPPMAGAYSVELIYPSFPAGTTGTNGGLPFPTYGFLKYSIPQPPGRQSVEVYYPYDFSQQRILTNMPPLTNDPQISPFEYPTPNFHQQTMPAFNANPLPSQDPIQPVQQDQPTQTNQAPAKL